MYGIRFTSSFERKLGGVIVFSFGYIDGLGILLLSKSFLGYLD